MNPSSKTKLCGSQDLKILKSLRITNPIETWTLRELIELKAIEKLNPPQGRELRNQFPKRLEWTNTLLPETVKQAIEDILVEYHDIFARHRKDIGMNSEFKVKLTPKDDKTLYSQSLPLPIHLKEDLFAELALMHKYGIVALLPFSKYASPIFAQRKPNGKLRLLVDLRKSTVWLRMTILTKIIQLAVCQMQHNTWQGSPYSAGLTALKLTTACRWRTNGQRKCLLSFSPTEALPYKRLAQDLSRSVSTFSSFLHEYLESVVKADQCAQYVDNIGIAADNATDLMRNIRAVFKCIC